MSLILIIKIFICLFLYISFMFFVRLDCYLNIFFFSIHNKTYFEQFIKPNSNIYLIFKNLKIITKTVNLFLILHVCALFFCFYLIFPVPAELLGVLLLCVAGILFFTQQSISTRVLFHQLPQSVVVTGVIVYYCSKVCFPFYKLLAFGDQLFGKHKKTPDKKLLGLLNYCFLAPALSKKPIILSNQLLLIMRNVIRLPSLDVSDILLPRSQIEYLDLNNSPIQNLDKAKKTGYTRFPLCKDGLDNCLGIIHIKDVFQFQGDLETLDLAKFQHQLLRFSEDTPLEHALSKLLKYKIHMALVVDKFGWVIGMFTLEDILEEFVGEIQDEFDAEDAMIVPLGKNTFKVSGLTPLHDLESFFNVEFNNKDISTLGGLISQQLGRIPQKDERVNLLGWNVKINEVTEQRIISVTIRSNPKL